MESNGANEFTPVEEEVLRLGDFGVDAVNENVFVFDIFIFFRGIQ